MRDTILQGDCMEELKNIERHSIDLIITDPPYSTPVVTSFGRKIIKNVADLSIQGFYFRELKARFEHILKPDGRVLIFCNDKLYPVLFAAFYDWRNSRLIVWDKGAIGMGKPVRQRHELIFYANQGAYEFNKTKATHCPSVLSFKADKKRVHGAQKPLELIRFLMNGFSQENDVVLDCFAGSNTTGIVAKELCRNYIGIELNPEYIELANKRLQQMALFLTNGENSGKTS